MDRVTVCGVSEETREVSGYVFGVGGYPGWQRIFSGQIKALEGLMGISDPADENEADAPLPYAGRDVSGDILLLFDTLNNAKIARNILVAEGLACFNGEIPACTVSLGIVPGQAGTGENKAGS